MENKIFTQQSRIRSLMLVSIFIMLSGCDKLSQENYDKLKAGMEYTEVVQVLGEPTSCETLFNAKNCVWGKDPKTITIKLISDKVILFSSSGL